MAGIDFDATYFPLVQITNHEGTTDAEYVALCARLDALLDKGQRFVSLVDATGLAMPSASQRRIIADWLPEAKPRLQQQSLGSALVMRSALQRGSITALNWVVRPYVPMAAFEARPEALAWCKDQLEKAGLPLPSGLLRLLRETA